MLIADWISITWPNATAMLVMYVLVQAFWPLTIVAAVAVWFWWRRRSQVPARVVAGVAALLWLASAIPYFSLVGGEAAFRMGVRLRQQTLRDPALIAGIQLPPGTLVTYSDARARNEIESLDIAREASVYGIPLAGHVDFSNGRPDGYVTLARDSPIDGVPCAASADVQLKNGTLDTCTLSHPSIVRGVPCRGEVSLSDGWTRCVLSSGYRHFGVTWRPGTAVNVKEGTGSFDIMSEPPNLYVLGSSLPHRAVVQFVGGRLYGINLTISPWQLGTCTIDNIDVGRGPAPERASGMCRLPGTRDGNAVLPPTAFTVR